jgi:hypothetical protein
MLLFPATERWYESLALPSSCPSLALLAGLGSESDLLTLLLLYIISSEISNLSIVKVNDCSMSGDRVSRFYGSASASIWHIADN